VGAHVDFDSSQFPRYGALGSFGVHGPGADGDDRPMLCTDDPYAFEPGHIYNLESDDVINVGGGFSGAHCDIVKSEVAHAVWEAAMT
jgi:hypothetical protein